MRRAPVRLAALAAALVLAFLAATPGSAWGKWVPKLRLHGAHGYSVVITGHGPTVALSAMRPAQQPRSHGGVSTYIARGRASSNRIEATFGDLGRVDVRFHPSGRVKLGRKIGHCSGSNRRVTRYGYYTGVVSFDGEGGYTAVHVNRAKGEVVSRPSLLCQIISIISERHDIGSESGGKVGKGKETSLTAGFKSGVVGTEFKAITDRSGKTRFAAVTERTEGRLGIYRVAFAKAPSQAFRFDSALSSCSVAPPAPFAGTASLQRDAEGVKSWVGSLSVSFPGEPNVPLTGPQFKTRFAQSF
jgi:hypothetical protein